jgi:hypothetical protein
MPPGMIIIIMLPSLWLPCDVKESISKVGEVFILLTIKMVASRRYSKTSLVQSIWKKSNPHFAVIQISKAEHLLDSLFCYAKLFHDNN